MLPVHDSETVAGVPQHLLYFCQSLFFQCVQVYTSQKPFSASPKHCSKSMHQTYHLSCWECETNGSKLWVGGSRVAVPWHRRWLVRPVGKVPHFSSCCVSCCGSLSPRIVTASKDAFAAVAAQPGLECRQCLSTGTEKQPCYAKMRQEGPSSRHWCKSHVRR